MDNYENDTITALVARVFRTEAVTWGDPDKNFIAHFEGQLYSDDTAAAYDRLSEDLRPLQITPLFRKRKGRQGEGSPHQIILLKGIQNPKPSNPRTNLIFFILTAISVLIAGMLYAASDLPDGLSGVIPFLREHLGEGLAFAASLLGILLAHEFGHYLVSRYHNTEASLPYFIPLPFSPLGTMGAVILQKEAHKNKNILLDIGMAGPLAGLVVAIPVLLLGLSLSNIEPLPSSVPHGIGWTMEGNSILYLLAKFVVFREWLPEPASYGGLSPILYWLKFIFTSSPVPFGGRDVMINGVAFAGWAGLMVTALNLIPAGQLDGGHILHGLAGDKARLFLPFILGGLILLGFVWEGWWLWALLIFFLGRRYAEPLDQITSLTPGRKFMAVVCLVIFVLTFLPVPLKIVMG